MRASLTSYFPLMLLLIWAAIVDVRERRIPNWLTFLMILAGIAQSFCGARTVSPAWAILGIFATAAIPLALFILGALGGGDVKLMAGIGAWLGPGPGLAVLLVEKMIGLTIVLLQAAMQGRTRLLLRNSAVVAVNVLHVRQVGIEHATHTGQACRSIDRPLPFAVPALLAVAVVLVAMHLHR